MIVNPNDTYNNPIQPETTVTRIAKKTAGNNPNARANDALKELERLATEQKKTLYPSVPECALIKTNYTDKSTNDLQTCLVDYLDLIGGWGVRVNTQGQYVEKLERHIPSSTKKGTPDVIGSLPSGRFVGIEVKRDKYDKLSEKQQEIAEDIVKAGGLHLIAYVGEFQVVYDRIQIELKK